MLLCLNQREGDVCETQNPDSAQSCRICGRSLRFALQLQDPGTFVASYRVVRVIGHGAFGAVYEVEDTKRGGVTMALKETFDPNTIQSFQREFGVLTRLRHPNLPLYYEMFEAHGNGYLVMEFVPGQNLEDLLQRQQRPLMEKLVLFYADQLCDVLNYLHNENPPVIHRDIKPANVRLTPEGLIKLVDFGLVKQGTQQHLSTIRGGTPLYMALEQLSGGSDRRSDIYSLGATLYHLLAGCKNPPKPVTDRIATTSDSLPSLRNFNSSLSSHVVDAIMKAMALRQKDRYQTVVAFRETLLNSSQSAYFSSAGISTITNPVKVVYTTTQQIQQPAYQQNMKGHVQPQTNGQSKEGSYTIAFFLATATLIGPIFIASSFGSFLGIITFVLGVACCLWYRSNHTK